MDSSDAPVPGTWSSGSGTDDPYPYLAAARRRGAVLRSWPLPIDGDATPATAPVCVLGYDEVVEVLRSDEIFSSGILGEIMGPGFGDTLIAMDEPAHHAHRALVSPAFRPKLLAHWEQSLVRRVADDLIDELAASSAAELVTQFTFAFPVRIIARILGLPEDHSAQFQRWSIDVISIFDNWDRGVASLAELRDYLGGQIADRRRAPRDDLISELVCAEVDGQGLGDDAIFSFLRLLLPAGIETTYRSLGNLLFGLLTHPDQLEVLVGEHDLRRAAIEEGLRWEAPFLMVIRQAHCDTSLAGVEIPRGSEVSVFIASANHDERRYPDPESFDIHRALTPHVSFGSGPHACLGMHLTRTESRVALDALLERLPNLRLDAGYPPPRITGTVFRSPDALPVRFGARR